MCFAHDEAAVGWDDDEDASASGRREETPKGQRPPRNFSEMFESESDPKLPPFYHRTRTSSPRAKGAVNGRGYSADERVDRRVAKTRIRRVSISRRREGLKTNATVAEANSAANAVTAARAKR